MNKVYLAVLIISYSVGAYPKPTPPDINPVWPLLFESISTRSTPVVYGTFMLNNDQKIYLTTIESAACPDKDSLAIIREHTSRYWLNGGCWKSLKDGTFRLRIFDGYSIGKSRILPIHGIEISPELQLFFDTRFDDTKFKN